jgi:signal transduction histidine kinase
MDQLRKTNNKLKESEKFKTQFLSNIRNEINNPMSSILGLSKEILVNPKKSSDFAEMIFTEASSLNFQLQNIIVAAEIEAGQIFPQYTKFDMTGLVKDVIKSYEHLYVKKDIEVKFRSKIDAPLTFLADYKKSELIIGNVLENSIKYSDSKSEIIINLIRRNESLVLEIIDFGNGMEKTQLKNIFDRFIQLDTGVTKNYLGHGLGLSVVGALTDVLGWGVEVETEIGKGTMFQFTINEFIEDTISNNNIESEGGFIFGEDGLF